jgi:hypothetical protein
MTFQQPLQHQQRQPHQHQQEVMDVEQYNVQQNQLNTAYKSVERTRAALESRRESVGRSLVVAKQEQRDTKEKKQFGDDSHKMKKLNERVESLTNEIKSIGIEEEKCYETQLSLHQQQKHLEGVRQRLGHNAELATIEPELLHPPKKNKTTFEPEQGIAHPTPQAQMHLDPHHKSHKHFDPQQGTMMEREPQQRQVMESDTQQGIQGQCPQQGSQGQYQQKKQVMENESQQGIQGQHQQQGIQGQFPQQKQVIENEPQQGIQGQFPHEGLGQNDQVMQERTNEMGVQQMDTSGGAQSAMSTGCTSECWEQPRQDARGTLIGEQTYDETRAREDAIAIQKALKEKEKMLGFGSDKGVVAQITGTRTLAQRQLIVREYVKLVGNDGGLLSDLKSKWSGDMERLVVPLYMRPGEYDAILLKKAMDGIGCDTTVVTEILCTRTNKQIELMKEQWREILTNKVTLEERIGDQTKSLTGTGHYRQLCLKLLEGRRPSNEKPADIEVQTEAQEFHQLLSGKSNVKDLKTKFVEVFTERSWAYIAELVSVFQHVSKEWTMNAAIKKEFGNSSDISVALCTIADFCVQPYDFWADHLRNAMKGFTTDDAKLIRIIVSRCEIDLHNISQAFGQRHGDGKTLKAWIESETKGDYRTLLLLLCGCQQQLQQLHEHD